MNVARPYPRVLLAVVVTLLVVVLGTSEASAAQLALVARTDTAWAQTSARCQSARLTVTAGSTATTVRVTGVTAACVGLPLVVSLYDPTVTTSPQVARRFAGSATAAATTTVTGTALTPAANLVPRVTIGGWLVPSTWTWTAPVPTLPAVSCRVPASPSTPCTATVTRVNQWSSPATSYQWFVTVSTTSRTPVVWELTFNLSDPAFPFVAKAFEDKQAGLVKVAASACSAIPRTVTVKGTTGWGQYHQVWAGKTSELEVQGHRAGTGNLLTCP